VTPAPAAAVNLLLVEDSPADVYLVREAMKAEGVPFRMQVADDGEVAIEILNQVEAEKDPPPDVLLLDLNVPRRDGIQILERIRDSSRCRGIPVVVISSSDSPVDRQRALALGARQYFRKPSTLDEFMQLGRLVLLVYRNAQAGVAP
jgi:CheY-like chemotaxis protein